MKKVTSIWFVVAILMGCVTVCSFCMAMLPFAPLINHICMTIGVYSVFAFAILSVSLISFMAIQCELIK